MYEERITLWSARGFDHAIEFADAEAQRYAGEIPDADVPTTYVELGQAYELDDEPGTAGAELFSLVRDSDLSPGEYIDRYFDTGHEHWGDL
jgi:hypothetical protein